MVEIPNVAGMVTDSLIKIETAARRKQLPITVAQTRPELDDTFFVNIIGRGYPSPTNRFRWCTERMKIDPTSRYIRNLVESNGEVIILLGARKSESASRSQALANREITGSRLRTHSTLPRCLVSTPIEDWSTNDVWAYLFQVPSPWGGNNRALFGLYKQAEGGECPLVVDQSTPSCGNSRFGCWTCTVVETDKAMKGFIDSGDEKLEPLLEFRDWLKNAREKREWRERSRKNGVAKLSNGEDAWGPFTMEARQSILRRLLETEMETDMRLISVDELLYIQRLWQQGDRFGSDTDFSVSRILQEVKGTLMDGYAQFLEDGEDKLLRDICKRNGVPLETMERLRAAEEKVAHLNRRDGIFDDLDSILGESIETFGRN
ncbi:MAG TPA: DNA phosphorothioation system sulfurtransferase DndC [Verrucomicrobiae bacterium]|nr:DNA phosphorothioation system sulfurtransferase DndC [Verrucomicrobiae bacterium]